MCIRAAIDYLNLAFESAQLVQKLVFEQRQIASFGIGMTTCRMSAVSRQVWRVKTRPHTVQRVVRPR